MEEKYKIHGFYIISILVLIIITLLAVEWTKIPDLVEYIAFALTVSSLILAILAIIYSMVSNETLNKVMQNLHISSSNLKDTSKEISEGNRILLEEIKLIPLAIESVDNSVKSTRAIVEGIALKETTNSNSNREIPENISDTAIENFLENSSIRGLEAIFAAVLSKRTKTAFNYNEIAELLGGVELEDYLFSYYMATKAIGLIIVDHDGKGRIIIKELHSTVTNKTEQILSNKLTEAAKDSVEWKKDANHETNLDTELDLWFGPFIKLKSYFGENA